jgi:hypothetical protein
MLNVCGPCPVTEGRYDKPGHQFALLKSHLAGSNNKIINGDLPFSDLPAMMARRQGREADTPYPPMARRLQMFRRWSQVAYLLGTTTPLVCEGGVMLSDEFVVGDLGMGNPGSYPDTFCVSIARSLQRSSETPGSPG